MQIPLDVNMRDIEARKLELEVGLERIAHRLETWDSTGTDHAQTHGKEMQTRGAPAAAALQPSEQREASHKT